MDESPTHSPPITSVNPELPISPPGVSPQNSMPTPKPSRKFSFLLAGLVLLFGGIFGGFFLAKSSPKACTLEAKICPDGSSVGRTGPNCEFASCPIPVDSMANWKIYTNTQYKYSIKYPVDYSVIESSSDYVRFSPGINDQNLPQRESYLSIQLDNSPQQVPGVAYRKTVDGKTLRISQILMDVNENQKLQTKAVFDQILSTFRFLK